MRQRASLPEWLGSTVVAGAAGAAGVAGSYGAAGFTPGYVVAPVESTLSRWMPGAVVTFAITVLGDLGQRLNLAFATLLVVACFALVAGLAIGIDRRLDSPFVAPVLTGAGVWAVAAALTLQPVTSFVAGAAAAGVVAVADLSTAIELFHGSTTEDGNGRRRVVSAVGTAAAAGLVGTALGRDPGQSSNGTGGAPDPDEELTFDVGDRLATARERSFEVDGMDPAVSDGFYQVDINSVDPDVDPDSWSLSVTGTVDEPFELTYDEIRERDHEHRFATLRCVSDDRNGRKTDTAVWTGIPVEPLIDRASPNGDCDCVKLHAADEYFQVFPVEALRPGMLAYGMNGRPLPRGHGAPVRTLVPGHWGEVNVKWLTEIEFLERDAEGYWEQRGWHGTGPVKTVAKLHGTERTDDGRVVVGGHAYAGTRGISEVEVSTDGGDTWASAELAERLPGAWGPASAVGGGGDEYAADAWRSWRHAYDPDGRHEVVVRAYERDGTLQTEEATGPVPDGAAGWVSETVRPNRL